MQIVITDGYTLNPGDLSWSAFETLGELKYYDRTPPGEVTRRCRNAHIIITNKTPVNSETITAAEDLGLIAVAATGYNIVDVIAAKQRGIPVCNVPEYGTDSVAQHTIALLLELTNHVGLHSESVANGEWVNAPDWSYAKLPIPELSGKTLGIVGFGRIGKKVASIAAALGMTVVFNARHNSSPGATYVTMEELFAQSDVISLHCPLNDNYQFVNKHLLSLMKPGAFLVNTSRGQLVNENDLAEALKNNVLAGAALDVLSSEPPPANHPLIGLKNCIITPHNAWISFEGRTRLMQTTYDNIVQYLEGKPVNVVNN